MSSLPSWNHWKALLAQRITLKNCKYSEELFYFSNLCRSFLRQKCTLSFPVCFLFLMQNKYFVLRFLDFTNLFPFPYLFFLPCQRLYIHCKIYLGKQKPCVLHFLVEKMLLFAKQPETVPTNLGATVSRKARIHVYPCDQPLAMDHSSTGLPLVHWDVWCIPRRGGHLEAHPHFQLLDNCFKGLQVLQLNFNYFFLIFKSMLTPQTYPKIIEGIKKTKIEGLGYTFLLFF